MDITPYMLYIVFTRTLNMINKAYKIIFKKLAIKNTALPYNETLILYLDIPVYCKLETQYCCQHSQSKAHHTRDNVLYVIAPHHSIMLNNYSNVPKMSMLIIQTSKKYQKVCN